MTCIYRLTEFRIVTEHDATVAIKGVRRYKQVVDIFESDTREKVLRLARKAGVKIEGNPLIEITKIIQ